MGFDASCHNTSLQVKEGPCRCDCVAVNDDNLMFVTKGLKVHVTELGLLFSLKTEGTPDYFLGSDHWQK